MKKKSLILVAALLALCLCACGKADAPAPDEQPSAPVSVQSDNQTEDPDPEPAATDPAEPADLPVEPDPPAAPDAGEQTPSQDPSVDAPCSPTGDSATTTPRFGGEGDTPAPVDQPTVTEQQCTCTISVSCENLLSHLEELEEDKRELVPEDGMLLAETTVTFQQGQTLFEVFQQLMQEKKLHLEFSITPVYHSSYVEGIGNLYELDCGALSGWMYRVNGWFPNYGSSRYALQDGDRVEWVYTCDLGADVGGFGIDQKQ